MTEAFTLQTPLWEIALRGSLVYLAIAVIVRLIPKRQIGNVSPNDLIALIIVGSLAADAIIGDSKGMIDLLLMVVVVLLWDYLFNLLEYHFPRYRRVAQDAPTLLIYNGQVQRENLRREKMTEEELKATLRKHGVADARHVKLAVLETDGQISVIEKDRDQNRDA